jgi:hypothetical protein
MGINYLPHESAQANPPHSLPTAGKTSRVPNMARQMRIEGFGNGTATGSFETVLPTEIIISFIATMNRDYGVAILKGRSDTLSQLASLDIHCQGTILQA